MQLDKGGLLVWLITISKFSTEVETQCEGRCLITNPMGKYTSGSHGTFVKTMLQSKLVTDVGIPDVYPQLNVIQKSMVVDSSPKLTHNDIGSRNNLRTQILVFWYNC